MRFFRYKRTATYVRGVLILIWVLLAVLPVTFDWFPFNEQTSVQTMVLLLLYGLLPVVYLFYLIQVAQTAVITLDDQTIGYHDRYTRIIAHWDDIVELTRTSLRLRDGRAMLIKLGVPALENWQDFERIVIERAHLLPAKRKGIHLHRWVRSADSQTTDVSP